MNVPIIARQFTAALRECERWGVPVRVGPWGQSRVFKRSTWSWAPVTAGIEWRTRTIYLGDMPRDDWPCAVIHELAHILAAMPPDDIDEPGSEMLAVEAEACRRLRLPWREWMNGYRLVVGGNWEHASAFTRGRILAESRAMAQARGLLDEHGRPTYQLPPDTWAAMEAAR